MLDALIPDGPLHPVDAAWGLSLGVVVAAIAAGKIRRWLPLVFGAVLALVGYRHGDQLVAGYLDRTDPLTAAAATGALVGIACARPARFSIATTAALAACVGVWAVVPDTEVPLIAGAVLVGASARVPQLESTRLAGLLALLPVVAAVAGSRGRPTRLGPALLLGSLGAIGVSIAVAVFHHTVARARARRGQRAGIPTTVAPAATSVVTTAPAPTTAP